MNIRFIIHCTDDTQIQKKITAQTKESIITHRIHIILWIVFFLYKTSFDIAIRKMQFGQSIGHFFNH